MGLSLTARRAKIKKKLGKKKKGWYRQRPKDGIPTNIYVWPPGKEKEQRTSLERKVELGKHGKN